MKANFTLKNVTLKLWHLFVALLMLVPLISKAQTKHIVEATNFVFTPDALEIEVGDTVEWRNNEGTHNVNGTQTTYPSNPESFGNDVGTDWVYSYVFTVAGQYDYQCDVHVAQGMVGTITVSEPTAVFENEQNSLRIYPNPASHKVWIETGNISLTKTKLAVYDVTGSLQNLEYKTQNNKIEFDIKNLKQGIYIIYLESPEDQGTLKLLKK